MTHFILSNIMKYHVQISLRIFFLLLFQLVIGCQSARKTTERRVLRLSGEEESGQFSGAEDNDLEDTRGRPMQKTDTNDDSRTGSSSGHSSGHMSHQTEISGNDLLRKITKKSTILPNVEVATRFSCCISLEKKKK